MAFDFSKVKTFTIPEGKVKSLVVGGKTVWRAKAETDQLTVPTISLDGDTLTMTADDRTEEFVIFVDGVEMATVQNDTATVSGTWYFNDIPKYATNYIIQSCNFTTEQGYAYNGFKVFTAGNVVVEFGTGYGEKGTGYEIDVGWGNKSLRTITFDGVQTVSKEFYDWLDANARQTITFTIDLTSYTALLGMTWYEWVESEYNTDNYFLDRQSIKIGGSVVNLADGASVVSSDEIISGYNYILRSKEPQQPV